MLLPYQGHIFKALSLKKKKNYESKQSCKHSFKKIIRISGQICPEPLIQWRMTRRCSHYRKYIHSFSLCYNVHNCLDKGLPLKIIYNKQLR